MAQFPFHIRRFPSALQDIANEMENIFEQVLNKGAQNGSAPNASSNGCSTEQCCGGAACEPASVATYTPALDVIEDDLGFDLLLDLPGVSLEKVKLELLEDKLHVTGTKTSRVLAQGAVLHRNERTDGVFSRSVKMPKQVDTERIEATFKDGVLHVRVPKLAKPTSRTIEVRTA